MIVLTELFAYAMFDRFYKIWTCLKSNEKNCEDTIPKKVG